MLSLQCLLLAVSSKRANSACNDDLLAYSYTFPHAFPHSFPHTCHYSSQGLPTTTTSFPNSFPHSYPHTCHYISQGLPTTTTNNDHCQHT